MENFLYKRIGKPGKFYYLNVHNEKKINDVGMINRFKELKIPPNYENVVINKNPMYKLQAYGYDSKGRKQMIYHKDFISDRSAKKFEDIKNFALVFDKIDKNVNRLIKSSDLDYEKVIAIVLYIMINCNFRIGNETNVNLYNSYGITTLRKKHIKIIGNKIFFSFIGKKKVLNEGSVSNKYITDYLSEMIKNRKTEDAIFYYQDTDSIKKRIKESDVNRYLKKYGNDISSKSIRIFNANRLFIKYMLQYEISHNITNKSIVNTIKLVSNDLHNTSAVCKRSYIHPELLDYYKGLI